MEIKSKDTITENGKTYYSLDAKINGVDILTKKMGVLAQITFWYYLILSAVSIYFELNVLYFIVCGIIPIMCLVFGAWLFEVLIGSLFGSDVLTKILTEMSNKKGNKNEKIEM